MVKCNANCLNFTASFHVCALPLWYWIKIPRNGDFFGLTIHSLLKKPKTEKMKYLFLLFCILVLSSCNEQSQFNKVSTLGEDEKVQMVGKRNSSSNNTDRRFYYDNLKEGEYKFKGVFSRDADSNFQSIYSSQNYGTFYHVYCKATYYINPNDNELYMDKLKLKILNYRGDYEIGFTETPTEKMEIKYNDTTKFLGLKLVVQGVNPNNAVDFSVRNYNIKKSELKMINVYRNLVRLNSGNRRLNTTGIFDSEFVHRNGLDTIHKKSVPGREDHKISTESLMKYLTTLDTINFKGKNLAILAEGENCYSSKNYVE